MHRLDLGLYSQPNDFWGNGVRTHVNSKEKIPSSGDSEEGQAHDPASRRTDNPTHNRLSYSGPLFGGSKTAIESILIMMLMVADYYTTTPATTQELTTGAALGQSQSEVAGMSKTNFIYLVCGVGAGVIALTVFIAVVCVRTRSTSFHFSSAGTHRA